MCVCVCVCVYVCVHVCVCAPMYTYICVNMCICDVYVCMYVCIYMWMYVCVFVYMCVCICICICMYICMCIYMCVYVCIDILNTKIFLLNLLYIISWLFILLCLTIVQFVDAEWTASRNVYFELTQEDFLSFSQNTFVYLYINILLKQVREWYDMFSLKM